MNKIDITKLTDEQRDQLAAERKEKKRQKKLALQTKTEENGEAPKSTKNIETYLTGVKTRHQNIPEAIIMGIKGAKTKCEAKRAVKAWRQKVEAVA